MPTDTFETRVNQFMRTELPGQPMGMHMGTSYLVSDLWAEVKRLREVVKGAVDDKKFEQA